jgi:hypothetical protein
MRITEARLRKIIRSVVSESTLGNQRGGLASNDWVSWASRTTGSHYEEPEDVLADQLRAGAIDHHLLAQFIVQNHTPNEIESFMNMVVPYDQV